jgi:hypothetical protein
VPSLPAVPRFFLRLFRALWPRTQLEDTNGSGSFESVNDLSNWTDAVDVDGEGNVIQWGYNIANSWYHIPSITNAVGLAAGYYHAVLLQENGIPYAWGTDNHYYAVNGTSGVYWTGQSRWWLLETIESSMAIVIFPFKAISSNGSKVTHSTEPITRKLQRVPYRTPTNQVIKGGMIPPSTSGFGQEGKTLGYPRGSHGERRIFRPLRIPL